MLAEGTEARFTVEGLKAVNRQLRQDILPQVVEFTTYLTSWCVEMKHDRKPRDKLFPLEVWLGMVCPGSRKTTVLWRIIFKLMSTVIW